MNIWFWYLLIAVCAGSLSAYRNHTRGTGCDFFDVCTYVGIGVLWPAALVFDCIRYWRDRA